MTRLPLLLLALALTPGVARAQNSGGGGGAVDPFTGALTTQVPIAVPDFRAITPALSLAYNSASGNGFVGVGWALTGTSIITRRSPGGGAPRYDASDVFYLDGAELLPCGSQGGTHCTWIQNYTRIRKDDPVVGKWTVTGTTGNVATYEPLLVTALGTESWLLTSIVDPNGNQVTYSYACDPPSAQYPDECYLDEVTYNGNSVRFHKELELRPDPIPRANGSFIALMRYRLKSIEVVVGTGVNAQTARAYQITYRESADTGRSIVDSVQQFGRGAVVTADGSVTGPFLPAMTFDYPTEAAPGAFPFSGSAGTYQALNCDPGDVFGGCPNHPKALYTSLGPAFGVGDFNGDGRFDVYGYDDDYQWFEIGLAAGDSSDPTYDLYEFLPDPPPTGGDCHHGERPLYAADLNADGFADLWQWCLDANELKIHAWISLGDGTFSGTTMSTPAGAGWSWGNPGLQVVPGDVDGDGRGDVIAIYRNSSTDIRIRIGYSQGDGSFGNWEETSHSLSWPQTAQNVDQVVWLPGDYNSDGHADLLAAYDSSGTLALQFAIRAEQGFSTGAALTPWPSPPDWAPTGYLQHFFLQGDANGDGALDFMMVRDQGGTAALQVALTRDLSPGSSPPFEFDDDLTSIAWNQIGGYGRGFAGDINADGTDELHLYYVVYWDGAYPDRFDLTTFFRRADGTYDFRTTPQFADYPTPAEGGDHWAKPRENDLFAVVDQDGGGVRDIVQISNIDLYYWPWIPDPVVAYLPWLSRVEPDQVSSVSNGIGGRSDIVYAPSSTWPNQYLPQGFVLQTVDSITTYDGRTDSGGQPISGTTDFTYEGALWSSAERRFLGFRRVTTVVDGTGATNEVTYHQQEGTISKPEWIYVRDAQDRLMTASYFDYSDDPDGEPPWVSALIGRYDYECNGATEIENCRTVLTQFTYDIYGNVLTTEEHGHYLAVGDEDLGDERTTTRTYGLDPTKYLVAQPLSEIVQQGTQKSKQTYWSYDANGNLIHLFEASHVQCGKAGCFPVGVNTFYTPDAYGNTVQVSVATSSLTTTFDPVYHRFPTSRCNSLSHCVTYEWDPVWGKPKKVIGPNGEETRVVYDDFARVTSVQRVGPGGADGGTTQYQYLFFGNPEQQRTRTVRPDGTGDGLWTEVYRDGLGREYKVVLEGGSTRTREFNGVLTRVFRASLWHDASTPPANIEYVTYTYDEVSRLRTILNADGSELKVLYGLGFRDVFDELHDELHPQRRIYTDGLGRTTQVRETNGGESYTTYSYDSSDRVIQSVDDGANVSTYVWNWLGNKRTACVPDMGCTIYVYGNLGTLTSQRNALNQTIYYGYDGEGRLLTKTLPGGQQVQWHYDEQPGHGWSLGRPTRVEYAPSASVSVEYDALGRVIGEDRCVAGDCSKHFEFSYDSLDRLTMLTYPDGEEVVYGYDTEGRLDRVTTPGPAPDYVTDLEWTPAGQLESMSYGNGAVTTYVYDPEREWLEHATVVSGSQTLYDASYVMDPAGRVDFMTVNRGSGPATWDFGYDDLNRLRTLDGSGGAPSETYTYDSIGNLLTKGAATYEYTIAGMPHAVSQVGTTCYIYDANGNRTQKRLREPTGSCASSTLTASYTYDAENRLTQFTDVSTGGSTSYAYAPGGRRVRAATAGGETRLFFGDLVETRDGADIYYYYAGPMRVAMKDTTGARTWYHHDHLGSVRLRTDQQGQEVETADYELFGEVWSASGEAGESPWDFAGHRTDSDSGLVYMNARYYDPEIGRFLTADPVVADPKNPQSLNRYAYVDNNPVSNVDPTGYKGEGGGGNPFHWFFRIIDSSSGGRKWKWNLGLPGAVGTVGGLGTQVPGLAALARLMLGFGSGYREFWGSGVLGVGLTAPEATVAVGWAWADGEGYLQKAFDVVRALLRLLGARDAQAADELGKTPQAPDRTAESQGKGSETVRIEIYEEGTYAGLGVATHGKAWLINPDPSQQSFWIEGWAEDRDRGPLAALQGDVSARTGFDYPPVGQEPSHTIEIPGSFEEVAGGISNYHDLVNAADVPYSLVPSLSGGANSNTVLYSLPQAVGGPRVDPSWRAVGGETPFPFP